MYSGYGTLSVKLLYGGFNAAFSYFIPILQLYYRIYFSPTATENMMLIVQVIDLYLSCVVLVILDY